MNLREVLEQRAERGTQIGSTALMNRIDSELSHRWFRFANPALGFAAAAIVTLVVIGGVLLTLRPDSDPVPPADISTTTTTVIETTTTLPGTTTTEATTTTAPVDEGLTNRQTVWNWDPATGDPQELREALDLYSGHPYSLIRLIDEGDPATRDVVFDYLKQPSAWRVQTLALMQRYGAPGGTRENPAPWPGDVKWEIYSALQEASQATFGNDAALIVDLQIVVTEQELDFCEEFGGCDFADVWYGVPQVVTGVDGQGDGISFSGSMAVTSDTGAGESIDFIALRTDEGWVLQEGYRTRTPFIAFMGPDSIVTTTADLQLWGYADPLASLSIDGRPLANDLQGGYWIADVWDTPPEPGTHEIVITATRDGETNIDSVTVRYEPDATRQFAFIRGVDTSGSQPALVVDYAEFLTGEEAVQAAVEDGELENAEEGLPNDYYIRNNNPLLRTLPFADAAPIYVMDYTTTGELDFDRLSLDNLVQIMLSGDETPYYGGITDAPVWLVVQDDVILSMERQYLP